MRKILISVLFCAVATPAAADWQATKWGMSIEEVMKATKMAVKMNKDRGQDTADELAGFSMPYEASGIAFTAYLRFDKRSQLLTSVSLEVNNMADCQRAFNLIQQKYGEPASKYRSAITDSARWDDATEGNSVGIVAIPSRFSAQTCSISYRPFGRNTAPGL